MASFCEEGPRFEAASIKPSPLGGPAEVRADAAHFSARAIPLRNLIYSTWAIAEWKLVGGPDWLNEAYDIEAALPPGIPQSQLDAQLKPMVQNLLADRFQLATHRETREIPVYAVVVDKSGSKLTPSTAPMLSAKRSIGHLEFRHASISTFVASLTSSGAIDRPLVDATGLQGYYDITFNWTPESARSDPAAIGPSVFTSLQEQLGLRLEPRKSPFECLVIDRIERPSSN